MDRDFIDKLVSEIDAARTRLAEQMVVVELAKLDELVEEQAELRNLVMRLQGLELVLRKTEEQAFGS